MKLSLKSLADFQVGLSKTDKQFPCLFNTIRSGKCFYLLGMKEIKTSKAKWGLPVSRCLLPFRGCSQRLRGILCLFSSPLAMALHLLCQLVTDGFLVLGCIVTEPWWALVIEWDLKENRSWEKRKLSKQEPELLAGEHAISIQSFLIFFLFSVGWNWYTKMLLKRKIKYLYSQHFSTSLFSLNINGE